jgi:hypothetical protein
MRAFQVVIQNKITQLCTFRLASNSFVLRYSIPKIIWVLFKESLNLQFKFKLITLLESNNPVCSENYITFLNTFCLLHAKCFNAEERGTYTSINQNTTR